MGKKNWKILIVLALITCVLLSSTFYTKKTEAANPPPFFNISILAPNVSGRQWCTLMVEQFPKIGIGIDIFDHTGWSQIVPRTWGHPGPYPIPSYENGGYDVLFLGWGFNHDYTPLGLYDSASITPVNDNFYQYSNPEMDYLISNYTQTYSYENRNAYAKEIQALLHEEQPSITVIYPGELYTMDMNFNLSYFDGEIWDSSHQSLENWIIPGQTEFHYASPADFEGFHIYTAVSYYDWRWLNQIYNGLIKRESETYSWIPDLASSFSTTDGLTWNFQLKPNVTWADGAAFTTQDVNYSYHLLLDQDIGYVDFDGIYYLRNSSINIINDYELDITFLEPYLFHDSNLAFDILPKHIWESIDPINHTSQAASWALTNPNKLMGTGAYYLEEYDSTYNFIHLRANNNYSNWSSVTPNFDDVYFDFFSNKDLALSALAAGDCDMIDGQFSVRVSEVPTGTKYKLVHSPGIQEMAVNCMHPIIGTGELCPISSRESAIHIRKAMSHLFPRDVIVKEILDDIGFSGITAWPPFSRGFDESLEPYEYNIGLARIEMRAAGYEFPEDSITQTTIILGLQFGAIISKGADV
ncbi:MAG: ABC transporter substrate-binding protein [Candidatus Heimdallarchaeota archaeon]